MKRVMGFVLVALLLSMSSIAVSASTMPSAYGRSLRNFSAARIDPLVYVACIKTCNEAHRIGVVGCVTTARRMLNLGVPNASEEGKPMNFGQCRRQVAQKMQECKKNCRK